MLSGLDQISGGQHGALRRRLRDARLGVLTHAAAVDRRGRQTLTVLEELGAAPCILFTPEHGFDASAQAEEPVEARPHDNGSGLALPVVSLYGKRKEELAPSAEQLANIDVLLIDLTDVGSRYYTYVWTALLAARAAAAASIHTVLLDRPNPISGDPTTLEGAPQSDGYLSFVGLEPLPIRHALTVGEILARFFERDGLALGPEGALSVVPVQGWERHRNAEAWGRPFVLPSPNMPTLETALVYPAAVSSKARTSPRAAARRCRSRSSARRSSTAPGSHGSSVKPVFLAPGCDPSRFDRSSTNTPGRSARA